MVAEHSTLRVTAEPFIPQKAVGISGRATPSKPSAKDGVAEFATPLKQYRLRELSPEEIAAKALRASPARPSPARPSPVRSQHHFAPVALFESPAPVKQGTPMSSPLRVSRNTCSKLHCKRCAYRDQQQSAKKNGGEIRRELEFQKDHDENCTFASLDSPGTPKSEQSNTKNKENSSNNNGNNNNNFSDSANPNVSPMLSVRAPPPELPKPPQRHKTSPPLSTSTISRKVTPPAPSSNPERVTNTPPSATTKLAASQPSAPHVKVESTASTMSVSVAPAANAHQQILRAGLLLIVAMLLVLLLVQRNGVWKSGLRTLAAAGVSLGTATFLAPAMVAARSRR